MTLVSTVSIVTVQDPSHAVPLSASGREPPTHHGSRSDETARPAVVGEWLDQSDRVWGRPHFEAVCAAAGLKPVAGDNI